MAREEEVVESIKNNVSALKFKLERQEAIEKLAEVDMTVTRLADTKAGTKITDVFRSSRFEQKAREIHGMWIAQADRDIRERWNEVKHRFLSKDQLAQLDRAQNKYNKKHGIVDASAITKKTAAPRADNPYQKVYQRHLTDQGAGPSTSQSSSMAASSSTTTATSSTSYAAVSYDPDSNFVAYNYSTVAIKRPRGRPRTNFSVKGEGGRKRGRPPTRRH